MVIGLEQLKPGMVLAEPVRNHQNMLLLESGSKISARAIRIFKSWGVTHVEVRSRRGTSKKAGPADGVPAALEIELNLEKKFAEVLDDPVMVTIMKAAGRTLNRHRDGSDTDSDR